MPLEGTLPKYLEFKTFELFRDRIFPIISLFSREDSKIDTYKHLFLCPSSNSKKHNFKLRGVLSPYVCLWRTQPISWNKENKLYGRSVLPRTIEYITDQGEKVTEEGFIYDIQTEFELYSSSYYRDFRDRVNQDLLDIDRQRFFIYNLKEMFPRASSVMTTAELILEGMVNKDSLDEERQVRSFDLAAKYRLKITVPYSRSNNYLKGLEVYLQGNKIYEKEIIDEKNSISIGK